MTKRPQSRLEKLAFLSNTKDLGRFEAPTSQEALQLTLLTMNNAGFKKKLIPDEAMLCQYVQDYSRALQMLEAYENVSDEEIDKMLEAYENVSDEEIDKMLEAYQFEK